MCHVGAWLGGSYSGDTKELPLGELVCSLLTPRRLAEEYHDGLSRAPSVSPPGHRTRCVAPHWSHLVGRQAESC